MLRARRQREAKKDPDRRKTEEELVREVEEELEREWREARRRVAHDRAEATLFVEDWADDLGRCKDFEDAIEATARFLGVRPSNAPGWPLPGFLSPEFSE